ncbi:MAG: hypothetical protein ACYC7E_18920 [Armatimonadota bacterium]
MRHALLPHVQFDKRLIAMRPVPESCTIVMVGSWNTRLLSISWISQYLFDGQEVVGEFSAIPGLPDRFTADDIRILPAEERLLIAPTKFSDELFQSAEEKAVKILRLLQYTPLRAVGVNYVFIEDQPIPAVEELFENVNSARITQQLGGPVQTAVQWSFPYEDGTVNVAVVKKDDSTRLSFNYNWDLTIPAGAVNVLEGKLIRMKQDTLQTISNSWELTLDEEEV